MNISKLCDTAANYVQQISWLFVILETAVGVVVGGLVGAYLTGTCYTKSTIALGIAYLALLIVKCSTQRLFPTALMEELKAKISLDEAKKQLSRRDVIAGYVNQSISALNEQTCAISSDDENALCKQAVLSGLGQVIEPLINRPQYLFDCNESQFTVACLVNYKSSHTRDWTDDFIVFRDDFKIAGSLNTDLKDDCTARGHLIDLQKALQRCYNDSAFVCDSYSPQGSKLAIIASPIPMVCETGDSNGILLFVTNCGMNCPADLENTLRIFGRIIANWLAKYSDCIAARGPIRESPPENDTGADTS